MKIRFLSLLAVTFSLYAAIGHAKVVFWEDFETYSVGTTIHGQIYGATTWSGVVTSATQSTVISQATAFVGTNSLFVTDNGNGAPRATINLTATGYISAPVPTGTVSFAVCEDAADFGAGDNYTIYLGNMTLIHDGVNSKFNFTVTGGSYKVFYHSGSTYTYAPGAWNDFQIYFDNVNKTASIYVNGGWAGTITGASSDFSLSQLRFGAYASGAVNDAGYFDSVMVEVPGYHYENSFETYTNGTLIHGMTDGTTTWSATSVGTADLAIVTSDFAASGTKSLVLADNMSNTAPRANFDFVRGGYIPAPARAGAISYWMKEDPNDNGVYDAGTNTFGNIKIMRDPDTTKNQLVLSMTGVPYYVRLPQVTQTYTYSPGAWNHIGLEFNDTAKTAIVTINGGFAGMITVGNPATSTVSFSLSGLVLGSYAGAGIGDKTYYDDLTADFDDNPAVFPWRSALYPANWQPGYTDARGNFLHDFSYAGYHAGAIPVPHPTANTVNVTQAPYNADNTGSTDATAAIQSALDTVGAAGGGVVYLPAGTYRVAPSGTNSCALKIKYNNVVLRGAGTAQTYLLNTNTTMRSKQVILVGTVPLTNWASGSWFQDNGNTHTTALSRDLTTPTTCIPVVSTAGFNVGDLIVVRNDLTMAFIARLGMTGYSGWSNWGNRGGMVVAFARRIVSIDAASNLLVVDVPTRYPVLTSATDPGANGRVTRPTVPMIREVGLEDFSIGMVENPITTGWAENDYSTAGTGSYAVSWATAIELNGVENSWVARVSTYHPAQNLTPAHIQSNGLALNMTRLITVDSCHIGYSQSKTGGGNGYLFTMAGQEALVINSSAQYGRHNTSFDMMHSSGNVFLNYYTAHSQNSSDFHQYLSMANLLDNVTVEDEVFESYFHTGGNPIQGWGSTESVFWNTKGLSYSLNADGSGHNTDASTGGPINLVRSQQFERGYVIGTQGPAPAVRSTNFVEGVGQGDKLVPQSLYLDQRKRRLGF